MFKTNYLHQRLSPGFLALFSGRLIQFVANGLLGLFLPIFFLEKLNYRIELVFLYYLISAIAYFILLPFGVQYLNKIGLNNSLRISIVFWAFYYISLYFIDNNIFLYLSLSLIILTILKILFWVPYSVDIAEFTHKKERGKEISILWGARTVLGVIMPVVAGFLLIKFSFNHVFILAIIIYSLALIPYIKLPKVEESYSWGYWQTFKKCFAPETRKLFIANMANGAEGGVGAIIWPIFIFQLLSGDFLKVGIISSLIVFVTVILQLTVGKYTDLFNKRKMLKFGSIFYATGWIAKIFVLTAGQIFVVGTYHSLAQIFKDTPFNALNYEVLADHGHYVDEYTVVKEIAIQAGKILILLFAIIVALNFGLNWTFALAAMASLFINVL
ncbi:MAG: MFS transporter [Patescibacteria group bacterium]|jgi:MFS family permease|nr:MFS transporter [Patescibacteria group bacterium]